MHSTAQYLCIWKKGCLLYGQPVPILFIGCGMP